MVQAAGPALQDALAERFLRYSAVTSQSDASAHVIPSTPGQQVLADMLAVELRSAGAADVHVSDTAVVTALVPGTQPGAPAIGFCTHLDTVDAGLEPQVRARVVDYSGGDLVQGTGADGVERRILLAEHPELARYSGQRILVSDGTSVLGADDKAGVSTVMQLAADLLADDAAARREGCAAEPRGDVYLSFVPDEEIGLRGVRTMDLGRFPVQWAYTLDSCQVGEVVEETFNAATVTIRVQGVSAHPMSAKGILVNPILIAHEVVARLDPAQTPECTQGRQGYTWVHDVRGNQSGCVLTVSVRDHDRQGYETRKAELRAVVNEVAAAHPRAVVSMEVDDVYANLADARTADNEKALTHVYTALDRLGITPIPLAMRGGTDGSWLSTKGIFTPNVFTGAHNFHSAAEFLPLPSLEASYRVCRELVRLAAGY
ncbi:peptidase T [Actinomyces faecalis]|uniref:peptidase T n=1 Tax=Actinomyces faecalis TaxID=2722820 RepID=UPI0015544189|nr:peptidase T [Actinomyces faecalis]